MIRAGIDLGSSGVKAVVLDGAGRHLHENIMDHRGDPMETLRAALEAALEAAGTAPLCFALTGSQAGTLESLSLPFVNEIPAAVAGALFLDETVRSVLDIGAQHATYITGVSPAGSGGLRFFTNSGCSAGTGAFLEEQASRLGISLEALSGMADRAQRVPRIAGRCSVFSKTDMIHHQQEGATVEEVLLGLVFAMVRNVKGDVLKKRGVERPVMLLGGVMRIGSVIRALKEVLRLEDGDVRRPEGFLFAGALGAAVTAGRRRCVTRAEDLMRLAERGISSPETASGAPCLRGFGEGDSLDKHPCAPPPSGTLRGALGIDVGSTSVNLVLIDENKRVRAHRYLRTRGRPEEVAAEGLRSIREQFGTGLDLLAVGTTGSGRNLIGKKHNADVIVNEITAQARGATHVDPDVDTVFEIGGQDSKYIRIEKGTVIDFEMNKICAAGTGSFLEAQAERIGVSLDQFGPRALAASRPVDLGDRCTVFIDGSIAAALARGERVEDIVAGLSYSIVNNYLNRVVGNRPVGDRILLQGGIAHNQAVVNAFRAVLDKPVEVPRFFSVTGALGAAVLALEKHRNRVWKERRPSPAVQGFWEESRRLFLAGYTGEVDPGRKTVGIPRVLFMHKLFVLFHAYFKTLGFNVLLSDETDARMVSLSQENALAETCYPVKLVNGHVASLIERGVDYIFLPSLYTMKHEVSRARRDYACAYMQQVPAVMDRGMDLERRGITLLAPKISFQFGKKYMARTIFQVGRSMGKSRWLTARAMKNGFLRLSEFNKQMEALGREAIESLGEGERAFVVITRPYGVNDPELNMGVPERLTAMGQNVLSVSALPVMGYDTSEDYPNMFWPFGQHILAAAKIIRQHPKLFAVFLTNHGCGPDLMLNHYFEKEMQGKPYLHLEVDEHASGVGVGTRLEAFVNSLEGNGHAPQARKKERREGPADGKLLLPHLFPYSHLLAEALKQKGVDAHVLPETRQESFEKGRRLCRSKEYLSLVSLMGDVLHHAEQCRREKVRFWIPRTEGTEISGQYEKLIQQQLENGGHRVWVERPFLEDLLGDDGYGWPFVHAMLAGDLVQAADPENREALFQEVRTVLQRGALGRDSLLALASAVHERNRSGTDLKRLSVVGDPLVIFSPFNNRSVVNRMEEACRLLFPPVSESLYFLWLDQVRTGRKGKTAERLRRLRSLLMDVAPRLGPDTPFAGDPDTLLRAADEHLPLFSGGNGRYRLAKILCCGPHVDGVVSLESMYENAGTVVMLMADRRQDAGRKPLLPLTFDGSAHGRHHEQLSSFLSCLPGPASGEARSGSRPGTPKGQEKRMAS